MFFARIEKNSYLLRLEREEEINASIKTLCQKEHIQNAALWAIGSIENPLLAHYRVDTKKYREKRLSGIFELVSLTGNVGLFENEPLVHTHVVISNDKMNTFGGHLAETVVSATVEVFLINLSSSYQKIHNSHIGLKLWELPKRCNVVS